MNERTGPLRNGNPRGNPNAAPRCNAACRTRMGMPCRSPAMANGRCRTPGGTATGPRTEAGRQRIRDANTIHGFHAKRLPDPFDDHVKLLLRRGDLMLALGKANAPWPAWAEALAALPPSPFSPAMPPAFRQAIERLCDDLKARWEAAQAPPADPAENACGDTPCTVSEAPPPSPRLRAEHFRLDRRVEIEHHARMVLGVGKTPCTVGKPRPSRGMRPILIPPILHFAPWALAPPGDPWGMSKWPERITGRGTRVTLPPEIG
jgi:hypothetical protein